MYILTLGRQPALGLAELEAMYGSDAVSAYGPAAALVTTTRTIDFDRLGGSSRIAEVIAQYRTTRWSDIMNSLSSLVTQMAVALPEGKVRLGLSYFGDNMTRALLEASALQLKKGIKHAGRSVRVVPNTAPELNSAQIIHNQLTGPTGIELVIVVVGGVTTIGRTLAVQDIEAYAARDQARPKRDARVGMLPPKLAQTIVNLAIGTRPTTDCTVLDPFCGTGVVLQEALLMGCRAAGADLEPRMAEYTAANALWLRDKGGYKDGALLDVTVADATSDPWPAPFDTVACETYLGRPMSAEPAPAILHETIKDCTTIHRKFLRNLARQTQPGFRACIAVPAWHIGDKVHHMPLLDDLRALGYNRLDFVHADRQHLVYHREGQIVGRELVVLSRI